MLHSISIRGRFLIAAMLYGLIAVILFIFVPILYSESVNFNSAAIVWYIPSKNFWLFGLALTGIFLTLIILALKRNVITYILSAFMIALSIFIGYLSFLSVTIIDNEELYIKDTFDEKTILWSDMSEIVLYYEEDTGYEEYVFTLSDGSQITLWNNPHLKSHSSALYNLFRKYNIPYAVQPVT